VGLLLLLLLLGVWIGRAVGEAGGAVGSVCGLHLFCFCRCVFCDWVGCGEEVERVEMLRCFVLVKVKVEGSTLPTRESASREPVTMMVRVL
jgi:hypothetical protein